MEKQVTFTYRYGNKDYPVRLTYKRMRRVVFRIRQGVLCVSAPFRLSDPMLRADLAQVMPKFAARLDKEAPLGADYCYYYGEKTPLVYGANRLAYHEGVLYARDEAALKRGLATELKKHVTQRVRAYEAAMGITPPYDVRVRAMESRYGSNSKATHRLTFAAKLIHYSPAIIDAIVVHELAHHIHFDHSRGFYETVLAYYPTYRAEHAKMTRGDYR